MSERLLQILALAFLALTVVGGKLIAPHNALEGRGKDVPLPMKLGPLLGDHPLEERLGRLVEIGLPEGRHCFISCPGAGSTVNPGPRAPAIARLLARTHMPPSPHRLETEDAIRALVKRIHRVAVLGIKTEAQSDQPAFYVPEYLHSVGLEVIPVPVYYPEAKEILGQPVYRKLVDIPGELDLVDVFRRPKDLAGHIEDILAKKPKAVWFQAGIRDDAIADRLAAAGIDVVQDRCLMVDHRRYA